MPTYPIRRRPRECKTCLPCRASKVRCDRNVPCANCVKRNFNCSYGRPPPTIPKPALVPEPFPTAAPTATTPQYSATYLSTARDVPYDAEPSDDPLSDTVTVSQMEWDEINSKMQAMEQILSSLHSLFQSHSTRQPVESQSEESTTEERPSPAGQGIYGANALKTGPVHIGSRSALMDILDKSKGPDGTADALPKDDLLAELALGNESAAYPFVDLWSSDPYTFNIAGVCGVLPDDEQCRKWVTFPQSPLLPSMLPTSHATVC